MKTDSRVNARKKRHIRIRRRIVGSTDRPRMCVFRSLRYMYVQFIDDLNGRTLASCSTLSKKFKERFPEGKNNRQSAKILGELAAEVALKAGLKKVVFDRSGYKYHGRIQTLTETARKKGLEF